MTFLESLPAENAAEPKLLYRLVEPTYADLEAIEPSEFYWSAIERTRERFGTECEIEAAVLARREGLGWRTVAGYEQLRAEVDRMELAEREALHGNRVLFSAHPVPLVAWILGSRREWLAVFRLSRALEEGPALLLEMARLAVAHRALEAGWTNVLDRARDIQRSLLPDPLPAVAGFEFAARSESAEEVGGDVFDLIRLGPEAAGLMIADASGHGLPAALEARDVVIGLRMGVSRDLKIGVTIERLNRILCDSTLSSRFVSLVYGEIDSTGRFTYVNAGHPAPLLITSNGHILLSESSRVLGVSSDSVYRVGHANVPPGGVLVLYTDGVTECPSRSGEEFGIERLAGIATVLSASGAPHVCAAIFDALAEHTAGLPLPDDATLLVARRIC